MTYLKLSFLFSTALACTLVACGSDDSGNDSGDDDSNSASNGSNGTNSSNSGSGGTVGSGNNGSGGTASDSGGSASGGSGNVTSGNTTGGSNACNPGVGGGSGGSEECTEYGNCVQRECASEYEECMGPNFANGDFSGGLCEDYVECANDCQSGDECDTACLLDCFGSISNACQSCLTAAGECGEEACPDEYEACNGEASTTTAGNTTGGLDGTCMDLEACCNSLEGDAQETCLSTFEAVEPSGDQACAILLATYQSADQC